MEKNLQLKKIFLDKLNPRFVSRNNKNQAITDFMIKHTSQKHLCDMTKDLIKNGLSPLDRIGVFLENGKYIAVDGNRRVLCLKLIYYPININVPEKINKIKQKPENILLISEKEKNLKENIPVSIFPDRNAAKKWLERKHTKDFGGASAQDWITFEKKIFNEDQMTLMISEEGDLAQISYDDYADKIKHTVWARMFGSSFSREWLGIDYSKETKEFLIKNRNQLHERMKVLVKASHDNLISLDKVMTKTKKAKLLKKLNAKYLNNSLYPKEWNSKIKKSKTKPKIKFFVRENMPDKLNEILEEINKIKFEKHIYLSAFAIRTIIEYCVNFYLKEKLFKTLDDIKKDKLPEKLFEVLQKIKSFNERRFKIFWLENNEYKRILNHLNWNIHIADDDWKITSDEIKRFISATNLILEAIWKEN